MSSTQTTLEHILHRIVIETDPAVRAELADAYAAELRVTLRTISGRSMSTVWSEKNDLLEQIGDVNVLISHLLTALNEQNEATGIYRQGTVQALADVNQKLDSYIGALPHEERERLIAQIANHEERITALERASDSTHEADT